MKGPGRLIIIIEKPVEVGSSLQVTLEMTNSALVSLVDLVVILVFLSKFIIGCWNCHLWWFEQCINGIGEGQIKGEWIRWWTKLRNWW